MTTFILKKYDDSEEKDKETKITDDTDTSNEDKPEKKELLISIHGTISETISRALNKVFKKSNINLEEVPEDKPSNNVVVSTEDINKDPIGVFKTIPTGSIVYIENNGFKTAKEEWFLSNLENKKVDVYYTLESFIKKLESELS